MKKILCLLLALILLASTSACQRQEENNQPNNSVTQSYRITYQGNEMAIHAPASDVIAALGEPLDYDEQAPCGRGDLDKLYVFSGVVIQTYSEGGVDYFSVIELKDDLVATQEGVSIGDARQRVIDVYGQPRETKNSVVEVLVYYYGEKTEGAEGMSLEFHIDIDSATVRNIVYRNWN